MRLTRKLYLFVVLGFLLVLSLFGYFSYQREVHQYETDIKRDAHILGSALSHAISNVWLSKGQASAMEVIRDANAGESLIHIRWVWLENAPDEAFRPQIPLQSLSSLRQGKEVAIRAKRKDGAPTLYTYVPVKTTEERSGALELSESLIPLEEYIRTSAQRLIFMACALIVVGGLLTGIVGHWMIGKPMQSLAAHAHEIGDGDLSTQLKISGHDEITELGIAMNAMSRRLQEARDELIQETNARIETLEQLRHAERLATLGRLSAGMAHELGTPLNVVSGRARLIATEDLEEEERIECARIIERQVERMTNTMRQLLDFARRRKSQKVPVDLQNLADQVLEMLNSTARKHRVNLDLVKDADIPQIEIDPSQMQQVLINLVMNGIQSMPGGGQLEMGVHLVSAVSPTEENGQEKECLSLYIKDEGEGISEENMNLIFDPFFTTKDVGQGTGLGLSIAYGIVQEHDGWVDVESEVGKGSCFTIYLPVEARGCTDES